jgi:uncharacterized DUF497 family protein
MEFDWNPNKARVNLTKHGVSFEEASTIFADPLYLDFFDPDHSDEEARFIIVGQSVERRLLVVSYTDRGGTVRLISAREATTVERKAYEDG